MAELNDTQRGMLRSFWQNLYGEEYINEVLAEPITGPSQSSQSTSSATSFTMSSASAYSMSSQSSHWSSMNPNNSKPKVKRCRHCDMVVNLMLGCKVVRLEEKGPEVFFCNDKCHENFLIITGAKPEDGIETRYDILDIRK